MADAIAAEEQYEHVLRLTRRAQKAGAPLPVALLQEASGNGYPPAIYALKELQESRFVVEESGR
jgi:hypothetical protein